MHAQLLLQPLVHACCVWISIIEYHFVGTLDDFVGSVVCCLPFLREAHWKPPYETHIFSNLSRNSPKLHSFMSPSIPSWIHETLLREVLLKIGAKLVGSSEQQLTNKSGAKLKNG